ncbi:MAG: flagellar filament capping protein FliD [Nitrospinota bacterium]|nr:flagellar filament capping protein FliD [Nitrospinota bacterium]
MAISVGGLASGLDTTSIITKLMELEKRPVEMVKQKQTKVKDQMAAWQEINTKLLALETAAGRINKASEFKGVKGAFENNNTSQKSDVVTVTPNTNISSGSYSFTVNQLAKAQKIVSDNTFSSLDANTGLKTMSITTANGTTEFTESTLSGLASAINADTSLGLTATTINTGGSSNPAYRLLLSSNVAGADAAFSVSAEYYPNWSGFDNQTMNFTETQSAQDAVVELDGMTITRKENSFDDLIDGVKFDLLSTGSGTITFESNPDDLVANVKGFVNAYNDFMDKTKEHDYYDVTTRESGILFGNSTLKNIQYRLRTIFSSTVGTANAGSGWYSSLPQIGIKSDSQNKIAVDEATLRVAIQKNILSVTNLFVSSGSGSFSFSDASGATVSGRYDTQVRPNPVSGVNEILMRRQGQSEWITLKNSGNFWEGPKGSDLEGLLIRAPMSTLRSGQTGSFTPVVGIAEQVKFQTSYLTEFSTEGAVFNQRRHLEQLHKGFGDDIKSMEDRIALKEKNLTEKYVKLEVLMSRLKGQSEYLTNQLANLPGLRK